VQVKFNPHPQFIGEKTVALMYKSKPRRNSQVRRLLHLLGRLKEDILLPLLQPSRRRHIRRARSQIKSGRGLLPSPNREEQQRRLQTPAASPQSRTPHRAPRSRPSGGGRPRAVHAKKKRRRGDCFLAFLGGSVASRRRRGRREVVGDGGGRERRSWRGREK
jgi:hypothetical protein